MGSAVTSLEKLPSLELCPIIERVSSKAGGKRPPLHKVQNKRVQIPPLPIITIDQFEANRKVQKSNSPILRQNDPIEVEALQQEIAIIALESKRHENDCSNNQIHIPAEDQMIDGVPEETKQHPNEMDPEGIVQQSFTSHKT